MVSLNHKILGGLKKKLFKKILFAIVNKNVFQRCMLSRIIMEFK